MRTTEESELLRSIYRGFPRELADRYQALVEKRWAETLTEGEHAELIRLTTEREQFQSERIDLLAKLAHLRHTSLSELAKVFPHLWLKTRG